MDKLQWIKYCERRATLVSSSSQLYSTFQQANSTLVYLVAWQCIQHDKCQMTLTYTAWVQCMPRASQSTLQKTNSKTGDTAWAWKCYKRNWSYCSCACWSLLYMYRFNFAPQIFQLHNCIHSTPPLRTYSPRPSLPRCTHIHLHSHTNTRTPTPKLSPTNDLTLQFWIKDLNIMRIFVRIRSWMDLFEHSYSCVYLTTRAHTYRDTKLAMHSSKMTHT